MNPYYTAWWKHKRIEILKRDPLCYSCLKEGKLEPSKVVDHIKAWNTEDEFYCGNDNLQGMCVNCHNLKTNMDRLEIYRKKKLALLEKLTFV